MGKVIISIRNRRRLAVAVIVLFALVSGTLSWVATREYSPEGLSARASAAFRDVTDHHITLGEARVSVHNLVTFEGAAVIEDGKCRVSAGRIAVTGVPRPLVPWRPEAVEPEQVTLQVDLSDPAGRLEGVKLLARLVERAGDIRVIAPEYMTVEVLYDKPEAVRYVAPSAAFLADERLDIITLPEVFAAPRGAGASRPYLFTATPDAITLSAPLDSPALPLAQAVAEDSGGAMLARLDGGADARFTAVWTAEDMTVTFTSKGWQLRGPAAEMLGPNLPRGNLSVTLTSFVIRNGRFDSSDGLLEFAADKADSAALAEWLKCFGLVGLAGQGAPRTLDNVRAAAAFRVSGDSVSIQPAPGRPALLWLDDGPEQRVLFSGSGAAPLPALRALAGAAPAM